MLQRVLDFLKFFPHVLGCVAALESAYATIPGDTKKQILVTSITGIAKVGEIVPIPMVAAISTAIDSIVTALNNAGVFSKGTATPAAVAAVAVATVTAKAA